MGNCLGGGSRLEETSGAQDGPQARSKPGMHGQAVEETMVERVISRFSTTAENSLASKLPDENTTEAEQTEAEDKVDEDGIGLTQQTLVDKSPLTAPNRSFKLAGTGSMGAGGKPMVIERQNSPFFIIRKTKDVRQDYDVGEELGHGQFGIVCVAVDKRTRKRYAMKSISKRKAESDPNFRKDIRTEVEIMYHLGGNSNIIQLYDVYEDADTIHLILELCEGGDWFQRLLAHGTYSEVMAAQTTRTILETLAYCHSLGVVHRDIKPENVLLADRTPTTAVKLADFGLSAMLPQAAMLNPDSKDGNPKALLYDPVGTAYYVAPEVLMARVYGKEVDIWSLGVVLYIVLGGYAPFDGACEQQILNAIVYQPLRFDDPTWNEISNSAKDLISRMLTKDPRKRATISELLEHPWLNMEVNRSKNPAKTRRKSALSQVPDAVVSRLQQFAAMNRFKKEARKILATFLPEEEVVGLLKIFKEMDTNGDGVLTLAELREALSGKGLKIGETTAKALLNRVDINDDEVIDYEEFLAATVHQLRLDKDELLYKAFQRFDRDKTGFITLEDLQVGLAHVGGGKLDVDAILKAVDKDCDGRINYEEFCNYLCQNDAFESEWEMLSQTSRSSRNARTLANSPSSTRSSRGPRPLLNSLSSRRRERTTSHSGRESRNGRERDSRQQAPRTSRPRRDEEEEAAAAAAAAAEELRKRREALKPTRSSLRRREMTSDPGAKEDVGSKSVRFREVPEVSAYSTTCPRDKSTSFRRSQLEPLSTAPSSGASSMNGRAPWEHEVLNGGAGGAGAGVMRTSLRSSIKRPETEGFRSRTPPPDSDDEQRRVVVVEPPSRGPTPTPPAGSGAAAKARGVVVGGDRRRARGRTAVKSTRSRSVSGSRSRSRSTSRGRGHGAKSPSSRARDLVRDASQRLRSPKQDKSLYAGADGSASQRGLVKAPSTKGRPVTLPNSASSRHLSRECSRNASSKSSYSSRARSQSPTSDREFGGVPDVASLRTNTLPVHEAPVSPSLLEFRRHSCISPQAPDLAPPDRRNPRNRAAKSSAVGKVGPPPPEHQDPPPPPRTFAKAWS